MNSLRRYSRKLADLGDETRSGLDQDAETGNGSGHNGLEAGGEENPYVLPESECSQLVVVVAENA